MRRSIQAALLVVATMTALALEAVPAFASHSFVAGYYPVAPGDTSVVLHIAGSGFSGTAPNSVTSDNPKITINSFTYPSSTQLDLTVTVAADAPEMTDFQHDTTITVTQGQVVPGVGGETATCKCIHVGPVIESFTPSGASANSSSPIQFDITGRGFHSASGGVTVAVIRDNAGWDGTESFSIPVTTSVPDGCNGNICTHVTGTATVTGYTPGSWSLSLKNKDTNGIGKTPTATFAMTGTNAAFAASNAVSPSSLGQGAGIPTPTLVDITGTSLYRGGKVVFKTGASPDAEFTQTGPVQFVSLTHIKVPVKVTTNATTGARNVTIQNDPPNGAVATCSGCMTVTAGPQVTSVTPNTLGQGATAIDLAVAGSGFAANPTVTLVKDSDTSTACDGVTFPAPVTFVDANNLVLHVNVATSALREGCTLVVHNTDQGGSQLATALTIVGGPTLSSISPASGPQGRTFPPGIDLTFTGSGFGTGANKPQPADVIFSGGDITVNAVTQPNAPVPAPPNTPDTTKLVVNISVGQTASQAARDVTVINHTDRGSSTCAHCFTVNPGPQITSISPNQLGQNAHHTVSILGSNFLDSPAPTVTFSNTAVHAGTTTFIDSGHIDVDVTVDSPPAPIGVDVTVTNNDTGKFTAPGALTINKAPNVTSFEPASLGQGATGRELKIHGSDFAPTLQPSDIVFSGSPNPVTISSLAVDPNGQLITATVDIASGATTGNHTITITNPDFGVGGCQTPSSCFSINAAPTISQQPNGLSQSAADNDAALTNFAVTGTNIASDAVVQLERNGQQPVPLVNTHWTNGGATQQVAGTLHLENPYGTNPALPAAPGTWKVRVTNGDGGSVLSSQNFTVNNASGAPTVSSISPNQAPQGAALTVTVNGSGFANGTTVDFGQGVVLGNVNVVSVSQLTADVSVSFNANPQTNNVRVTNTDAQSGQCANCLLITPAPTIDGVDPEVVNPTGQTSTITIFGQGFQSGATVVVTGPGINLGAPTVTSTGTIEVPISVDEFTTPGRRTVRVTNPDGGIAACIQCLRISNEGYWMVASDGGVFSFPDDRFYGGMGHIHLNKPIVGMAATPTGLGYWMVASDGGIFSFGDAHFFGSTGSIRLNQPIVGMAATPSGNGYWLVASDGGIFSFGDAQFFGSMGAVKLNKPVVGMAGTSTGDGYWMVASDGGIFSFGDAEFFGSTGSIKLNQPIVGMIALPDGSGYRFVAADGGIFNFGIGARNLGSMGGKFISAPIVGITQTISGNGYWLAGSDGNIYAFGDADKVGSMLGTHLNQPVVAVAAST